VEPAVEPAVPAVHSLKWLAQCGFLCSYGLRWALDVSFDQPASTVQACVCLLLDKYLGKASSQYVHQAVKVFW
jgi:hypothetical protein